jgi:hypothetical protein
VRYPVSYGIEQDLTTAQKELAQRNIGVVTYGVWHKGRAEVTTIAEAHASGTTLTLPNSMTYVAGYGQLLVSVNGVLLMAGKNYNEIGVEGATATAISLLMPLEVGDEAMFWTTPGFLPS